MPAAHQYDQDFMQYAASSSAYSAARVTRLLLGQLSIDSVLDVGCAYGTWLRAWSDAGIRSATGIDGDYIDCRRLEIPPEQFVSADLSQPFDLGRQFDLVQSLEVGEHIAPVASAAFAESIARHARKYILFSAAPPGQGGEFHINERPYDFWRELFRERGFSAFDWVRGQIADDKRISYWYRYNTFLYVRREIVDSLPSAIAATALPDHGRMQDVAPLAFRLRKGVIRLLPFRLQHEVARLKARLLPTGRF